MCLGQADVTGCHNINDPPWQVGKFLNVSTTQYPPPPLHSGKPYLSQQLFISSHAVRAATLVSFHYKLIAQI